MNKTLRFLLVLSVSVLLVFNTACSLPFISGGDNSDIQAPKPAGAVVSENELAQTLIIDYFRALYSKPVMDNYQNLIKGLIPEDLKNYIAKSTIDLQNGNPEIAIHLPRIIQVNDYLAVNFEISQHKSKDGKMVPEIDTNLIGEKSGNRVYYIKVDLKAKCIDYASFEKAMGTLNVNQPEYFPKLISNVTTLSNDATKVDYIRIQVCYDVELVKEKDGYKVVSEMEANTKPGFSAKNTGVNNDFAKRIEYLNTSKASDGSSINKDDTDVFNKESALIKAFFSNYCNNFDDRKMKLLLPEWNTDMNNFKAFMQKLGVPKGKDSKNIVDFMDIQTNYKQAFDYSAFPIQLNMQSFDKDFASFNVVQHPAYSGKQKRYILSFEIGVKKINGLIEGVDTKYKYNYEIKLSGSGDSLKISNIKLNEFYQN